MKLGLYGGSFDPVHLGHLLVAQAACEELQLDRLVFLPAAQSPFKPEQTPASAKDRLRLLRMALVGCCHCDVDDQEIRRGGTSYTIHTVEDYVTRFPGATLYYLIGSDHVKALPKWRDAAKLASLLEFVVIARPGDPVEPAPSPFRVRALRGFPLQLSSSEIRDRVRQGLPIRHLVPSGVEESILNNRLYLPLQS